MRGRQLHRARKLRHTQTDAERRLWQRLRNRRLTGHKFRRQYNIGPSIVDFVCLEEKLIVEVDGGQHIDRKSRDNDRTAHLSEKCYRVIRFWNDEVLARTGDVLEQILRVLREDPSPLPSALRGDRET